MKKQLIREDKRVKLYLMNQNWLKIRKQKDRRRRKVLTRLWRMSRLTLMKTGRLPMPTLSGQIIQVKRKNNSVLIMIQGV